MMTAHEQLERALRRVLWRIRHYLPDMVVIGGWVPHLYRRYGGFAEWWTALSGTAEVDVLIAGETTTTDRPPLAAQLAEAGFRQVDDAGAVWENDPATGEKIEFFVPHRGPFATLGKAQAIRSQDGIAAMALDRLEVLAIDVRVLRVPLVNQDGAAETLEVRVPSLGAYVVAKASTFQQRTASPNPAAWVKRAKDLVYVRDVMAAGREVVECIEADLGRLGQSDPGLRAMRYAESQLRNLAEASPAIIEAALELAERDTMSAGDARLDLLGHVMDLVDILRRSVR